MQTRMTQSWWDRSRIVVILAVLASFGCGIGGESSGDPPAVDEDAARVQGETVTGGNAEGGIATGGASDSLVSTDGPQAIPGPESPSPTPAVVPPGGLERWVAELRAALEPVELDPRNSYEEVLRLYLTYQLNIIRFYGEGGELTGDEYPELAANIEEQDHAFMELLEMTELTVRLRQERSELLNAIHILKSELTETLEMARQAGVPLDRP